MSSPAPRIAVVGLACRYPGAASPEELWGNALAGRRAFRRIPPERLRLEDYLPGAVPEADSLYCTEAALLEDWEFDRVAFRVSGPSFRAADPAHWLALEVAERALADAGFPGGEGLPREAVGVLLGNTLTGEVSRAQLLRLRWPYVRRALAGALADDGWEGDGLESLLRRLEERFQEPFEPPGEESLAGGLANTIAGRICNHFDLGGGGYTVDGACASSLLAVAQACSALATAAVREPSGSCTVTVRTSETGFRVDHFRARCRLDPASDHGPSTSPEPDRSSSSAGALLELDPGRDLYGGILFHRGRFRRLRGYRRLRARECEAVIGPAAPDGGWFGRHLPAALLLGDPGARDAAIHAVQASIPHVTVLPLGVERLETGRLDPEAEHTVEARERSGREGRLVYDLVIRDRAGRVAERWHSLTLALVAPAARPEGPGSPESWPAALLGPLREWREREASVGGPAAASPGPEPDARRGLRPSPAPPGRP